MTGGDREEEEIGIKTDGGDVKNRKRWGRKNATVVESEK